jgi:hypothetical protein
MTVNNIVAQAELKLPNNTYYYTLLLSAVRGFMILYFSPKFTRAIKSRRMRWAGRVACIQQNRNACRILVGKHVGKYQLKILDVDERIILK